MDIGLFCRSLFMNIGFFLSVSLYGYRSFLQVSFTYVWVSFCMYGSLFMCMGLFLYVWVSFKICRSVLYVCVPFHKYWSYVYIYIFVY